MPGSLKNIAKRMKMSERRAAAAIMAIAEDEARSTQIAELLDITPGQVGELLRLKIEDGDDAYRAFVLEMGVLDKMKALGLL